ncbi:Uncharacterised protein [Mycobacteroides abscessus subsp. bolletii]|nr:Uncharacterised protein [Mycobacteroides abscessus subsp. bolletii]
MSLPLTDIKRAKVQSFRDVADALDGMASANRDMKRGVGAAADHGRRLERRLRGRRPS